MQLTSVATEFIWDVIAPQDGSLGASPSEFTFVIPGMERSGGGGGSGSSRGVRRSSIASFSQGVSESPSTQSRLSRVPS